MPAAAEVFAFGDPVTRAIRYLRGFGLGRVERVEPDGDEYDQDELLILVHDGGGSGAYDHQLADTRLTFEVRSGSQREAAEVASKVEALTRSWPYREGGVYYRGSLSRPQYQPEADRRIPAYIWTATFAFRGAPLSI